MSTMTSDIPTSTVNWHVQRARTAKASVIAAWLKAEEVTAAEAVEYSPEARHAAARLAGKSGASADTWSFVVAELAGETPPVPVIRTVRHLKPVETPTTPEYSTVPAVGACGCHLDLHVMSTALVSGIARCATHGNVKVTS